MTVDEQNRYYYGIFGECYVHGMMDEDIKYQNTELLKVMVLELR